MSAPPLISCVEEMKSDTITVVELSSFQLELIEKFRPDIGLFLNLTPDHLDRHKTMEAYAGAKARIFENQTELDAAVLNADDPPTVHYAPKKPQLFWFSRKQGVEQGACLRGDDIIIVHHGKEEFVMKRAEIPLAGAHNVENVLAAVTAARLAGVDTVDHCEKQFATSQASSIGWNLLRKLPACVTSTIRKPPTWTPP